ncbi:MAG: hypothetical protein JRE71_14560 [Deltaproteobacteria bacterium]|nr:hypothetical protein [Deltaproteobacteria bacterium]
MSDQRAIEDEALGDDDFQTQSSDVTLDRISSFRVTYVSILVFLFLYLFTVQVLEEYLRLHFEQVVAESIKVEVNTRAPGQNIRLNLIENVRKSRWVEFWRVKVDVVALARDGETWLYVNGRAQIPSYPNRDPATRIAIHAKLLPATATVDVSVDHNTMLSNTILIGYGVILFVGLFTYNKRVVDLENRVLEESIEARNNAALKARQIEKEIESVRAQLREVEPAKQEHRDEIAQLQSDQTELQAQLNMLATQERELRNQADRSTVLEEEGRALEELLEEATGDLDAKNLEIRELEKHLKRVSKIAGASGGRSKESEVLARRMRVLYPRLDIDDRAIDDIVGLPDEITKLRTEECIKRLGDDADNVGVRRKVGGLPNHLAIYELGFAGKRRIYYAKVQSGRYRVLVIGAKNTQQSDLDYISRIPKGEIVS